MSSPTPCFRSDCNEWVEPNSHLCRKHLIEEIDAVASAVQAAVTVEREACAMLHESIRTNCDHEPGAGAGAMGAVIAYRDAIRARSAFK